LEGLLLKKATDRAKRDSKVKKFPPSFEVTALEILSSVPQITDTEPLLEHSLTYPVDVCAKEVTITRKNMTPIRIRVLYKNVVLIILNIFLYLFSVRDYIQITTFVPFTPSFALVAKPDSIYLNAHPLHW
tara:strand:- start:2270 stop:2659 length:390 start_codon:yes stop_codon:yes gene_type:complete